MALRETGQHIKGWLASRRQRPARGMLSVWLALAAAAVADDRAAAGYPGLAVHQMYAREMLGEPSCRAYVSDPAWAYALLSLIHI